ncbi:MAG: tetraacyldisaccharide 4'-kinase [Phycisphaerales bacterium]|nr:tetraacyldisaccharide 4'-kinase [Phycisphaerales bacterium]
MPAPAATAIRVALSPLSWIYGRIIEARNRRFDRDPATITRAAIPVICIGNLTTGGSGKTPLVMEVARRLADCGVRPAISTRGYGAKPGEQSDEVMEYRAALPDTPVVVDPDRVRGAAAAAEAGADCLVMDDGFQHRRLHRDLDIVLIDALDPWGADALLPAGRLREPLSGLRRADLIVITRRNQVTPAEVAATESRLETLAPETAVVHCDTMPTGVFRADGEELEIESLQTRCAAPVCGIGNPQTFLRMAGELCGHLTPPHLFRDHHHYTAADVRAIADSARHAEANIVLTTRKDSVKLAPLWAAAPPDGLELVVLEIGAEVDDFEGEFDAALQGIIELCENRE